MKLSTIMANYDEFQSSYKKIGYDQKTINVTDKRQFRILLDNVIDDILLLNQLLNVYDYTEREKKQILNWLNKIGRKRETFMQMLVELNIENYYEDSSITEDDYTDLHLFESVNNKIKMKYVEVDKTTYQTATGAIEFNFTLNDITATGFWTATSQYLSEGVNINELRPITKKNYRGFNIFEENSNSYRSGITSGLYPTDSQPKNLRFTGRKISVKNLKNVFIQRITEALYDKNSKYKLTDEFLEYFGLKSLDDQLFESENFDSKDIKIAESFLTEVKKFRASHEKLLSIWDLGTEDVINEIANKRYPFQSSFDEYDLVGWEKNIEANIKKLKSGKLFESDDIDIEEDIEEMDFITEDDFNIVDEIEDMTFLMEAKKDSIEDCTFKIADYFSTFEKHITKSFNLKKFANLEEVPYEKLTIMLCNLEDEKVMADIGKGNYMSFDFREPMQFNDSYEDFMEDLGYDTTDYDEED